MSALYFDKVFMKWVRNRFMVRVKVKVKIRVSVRVKVRDRGI